MNKRLIGSIAVAATLALMAPTAVDAQRTPNAREIGAWVQGFYDQTQTMSARFVQHYTFRVQRRVEESRGTVRFRKPGMMRFDYENGKVIVTANGQLTAYEPPDEGESRGQYYQQEMNDSQLPSALSFLTGTGRLQDDYRMRRLDPSRLSYEGEILELRSRTPNPHYSRILLFVDDEGSRRGAVDRIIIVDDAGNRNQFDFTQQRVNQRVPESTFRYAPPQNARRITP